MGIATYTIKYKADGVQPDSLNPGIVTIKCSSNDLDIAPVEVSFPVKYNTDPPEEGGIILVNFNKESFSFGDTATTNCRWLTGYNELIDFPSEQSFDVEITGGSEYGELQNPVSGEVGTRLEAVSNGFRVLTATEIAEEEVRIILRVSTIVGGGIATRPANKKGSEEEKTIDKEVKQKEPIRPELIIIGGEEEIVGFGDVVVKKDGNWCDDLDECDEIQFPDIELNVHENNWEGFNVCPSGFIAGTDFFTSDNSNYREDFDIELCKEENNDKIQFTFDDDIVINCVSDMCEANISAGEDILIDDVYSFPQNTSCKDKLFWLELHKNYPYPTKIVTPSQTYESVYVIKYIWMRHEEGHREHFLNVAEGFKEKYLVKIKETKEQCFKFNGEEEAITYFKEAAEKIIKQFYDAVKNEDDRISSGGDDGGDIIKFEKEKIHKKVIDDYIQPLIDRWKLTNCVD